LSCLRIHGYNQAEGLYGMARGKSGSPNAVPTTTYIQSIGLGEMWDRDLLQKVAAAEGYEARWLKQTQRYRRSSSQSLVIRAPNADFGRDIRWGRTEECYGEDAFLNGTLTAAFVRSLQGNDPKWWQTAALLKHFLANSNENGRFTECLHGVVQSRGFAPSTAGASRSTQRSPGPSRCYHQIPTPPFRLDHSWRSPPGRTG
jgi:beta-glucosidase